MTVGYATGALSLSMEIEDLTDTVTGTASNTTTTSATYVTGLTLLAFRLMTQTVGTLL